MRDDDSALVFVVDDEKYLLSCYEDIFSEEGIRARYFTSGEQALSAADERMPRVLVTDFSMSGMTGFELASKMREADPGLHVILLTGFSDEQVELKKKADETGMQLELMEKPVNVRDLLSKLAWMLDPGDGPDSTT